MKLLGKMFKIKTFELSNLNHFRVRAVCSMGCRRFAAGP